MASVNGEDILIAGATSYNEVGPAAICGILAEWRGEGTYAERIAHLTGAAAGGLNGTDYVRAGAAATVFNDASVDNLSGSKGLDWFLYNRSGVGPFDSADRSASEQGTDL